jgi:hypothetical protein
VAEVRNGGGKRPVRWGIRDEGRIASGGLDRCPGDIVLIVLIVLYSVLGHEDRPAIVRSLSGKGRDTALRPATRWRDGKEVSSGGEVEDVAGDDRGGLGGVAEFVFGQEPLGFAVGEDEQFVVRGDEELSVDQ